MRARLGRREDCSRRLLFDQKRDQKSERLLQRGALDRLWKSGHLRRRRLVLAQARRPATREAAARHGRRHSGTQTKTARDFNFSQKLIVFAISFCDILFFSIFTQLAICDFSQFFSFFRLDSRIGTICDFIRISQIAIYRKSCQLVNCVEIIMRKIANCAENLHP